MVLFSQSVRFVLFEFESVDSNSMPPLTKRNLEKEMNKHKQMLNQQHHRVILIKKKGTLVPLEKKKRNDTIQFYIEILKFGFH